MTREEYKKNLIRMLDSVRNNCKGEENCAGIDCDNCPFNGKVCGIGQVKFHAYEAVEIVEQWAKEHPIVTNAMKFKEVFGVEYDAMNCCMINDDNLRCENCEYYDCEIESCEVDEKFWNAEYKPKKKGKNNERI